MNDSTHNTTMLQEFYKKPILSGIVIAAIIHSIAILTRELSPTPVFPVIINALAFNGSWIYMACVGLMLIINAKKVGDFFTCIPQRVGAKTIEGQKLVLGYEFISLFILLFAFPAITYFYGQVEHYFAAQHPELHRFIDYMPFTDLINRAMTSFPFFITLFVLVSLICVIAPHTYFAYKCAKRSTDPLHSAIGFSILLSTIVMGIVFELVFLNIESWMAIALIATGPVVLISLIIINIMMLRYHNKFILCDELSD
ncbi:hypothetical protein A2372_02545 [Candidatus Wolfebacteria bacterium RIFOXYB1_FULL_54_12]|uniref:Uncharacterized protein n=1 Tax=Candidatus Wolfebacteria bacterium RIFOXYB1_FULL_54_12 TaxID=1802559 RepID=A0A1F8DXI9_9BACT|nr:MAG: hypothetical protein A2372_02545 [Candidatus Wolfebacteria bacterium RIFOXYB1_FULL_54_12]